MTIGVTIEINDAQVMSSWRRAPQVMAQHVNSGLDKAGMVMAEAAKARLRRNGSMGFSTLMDAIRPTSPAPFVREVRPGVKHAAFVEFGTKASGKLPAVRPLSEWIRIKSGGSDYRDRGWALAQHIKRHGTKAHPFLQPSFQENESKLMSIIRASVASGMAAV